MKILKSKKMLLSLVCALVLVVGSCMTVCAEEETTLYDTYGERFERLHTRLVADHGEFTYLLFSPGISGSVDFLCASNEPFILTERTSQFQFVVTNSADSARVYYSNEYGTWDSVAYSPNTKIGTSGSAMIITNFDLYDSLGALWIAKDETDFFPKFPILSQTVAGMEMNPLVQILGLVPLLIPCLVGLVALRKGLQALWGHLRKA